MPLHPMPAVDGFRAWPAWSAAKENFHFTKGEDLVKRYESELAPRNFCSNCGSSIYDDLGEKYFVAAGLMRDLDLTPSFHLQVAYKANGTRSATTPPVRRTRITTTPTTTGGSGGGGNRTRVHDRTKKASTSVVRD